MNMCILTNDVNLNKLKFSEDYINGIVENKNKFIGIPLVVNREKLENGLYKSLTHEFNKKSGELKTDQIGSFVDFWSETDGDGTLQLMGSVRIQKRYPNVCNAIIDLYENEMLEFSCEIVAYGYVDINEDTGVRTVDYSFEEQVNVLLGSCIVSNGAEVKSKASLLVAEALNIDLKGGEGMDSGETVVFNKNIEIRYHGNFELSSLKFSDVSNMIYNILNPINPKSNYRDYNYYISDLYLDYVIVEDWDDYVSLYKIFYKIENELVILDDKSKWIKGYKGFIPDGVDVDSLTLSVETIQLSQNEETVKMNKELEDLKLLNEELVKQVGELKPFKEKVELSEKTAKTALLKEKFTKLLSEDVMKSEQVVNAIELLDEQVLNAIAVAELSKGKSDKVEKKEPSDVVVVASRQDQDLIPSNILQKYGM